MRVATPMAVRGHAEGGGWAGHAGQIMGSETRPAQPSAAQDLKEGEVQYAATDVLSPQQTGGMVPGSRIQ